MRTPSSLCLRPRTAIGVVLLTTTLIAQSTLWVAAGTGPGCGTESCPYTSIQTAIGAAVAGDLVLVGPGTYLENVDFTGKDVRLRATGGAAVTVIDGGGGFPCVRFVTGETAAARLEGFTLTNGFAIDGGGILCVSAAPTIEDCVFSANDALNDGGALHAFASSPVLRRCHLTGNTSGVRGGAISSVSGSTVTLESCVLVGNATAGTGGALATSTATFDVSDCLVDGNVATQDGGGMAITGAGQSNVRRSVFRSNTGDFGGALAVASGDLLLDACRISLNHARFSGGGLSAQGSTLCVANSCQFAHNTAQGSGGGLYAAGSNLLAAGCTVADNAAASGGGLYLFSQATPGVSSAHNGIFWGNAPDQLDGAPGSSPIVSHSTIAGGWPGTGNLASDPQFVSPTAIDYRLAPGSPVIDAGSDALAAGQPTDLDGRPRRLGSAVDMGAHEFAMPLPGTTEDLALDAAIDGRAQAVNVFPLTAGQSLSLTLASPLGTFVGTTPLVLASLHPTLMPPPGLVPGVHVDLASFVFLVDGTAPFPPFFNGTLGAQGITLSLPLALNLTAGSTIRFQGFALSPLAANGLFAATDALDLVAP